jgi:hypothetical protein
MATPEKKKKTLGTFVNIWGDFLMYTEAKKKHEPTLKEQQ